MNASMLPPIALGTRCVAFGLKLWYIIDTTIAKKGIAPVKTAAIFLEVELSLGFSAKSALPVINQ
jgi:hypothetical protein